MAPSGSQVNYIKLLEDAEDNKDVNHSYSSGSQFVEVGRFKVKNELILKIKNKKLEGPQRISIVKDYKGKKDN